MPRVGSPGVPALGRGALNGLPLPTPIASRRLEIYRPPNPDIELRGPDRDPLRHQPDLSERDLVGRVWAAAAHSNGAPFTRLDNAIFQYNLPAAFIGDPLFLKFQSFNIFGQSVEDLSECAVYTYTPSGAG
jgi:hypothetical protein